MKRRRSCHSPIDVVHTVLSACGSRSSRAVARRTALLFLRSRPPWRLRPQGACSRGRGHEHGRREPRGCCPGRRAPRPTDSRPGDRADAASWPCAPPSDPTQPPSSLAETGCMGQGTVTTFAASAHGYDVNSPLWSDGADKQRAFVLPPGGKIHVVSCAVEPSACAGMADDGKWVFPVGTTMVKSFGFDGKLVETRLLVALPDGTWIGLQLPVERGADRRDVGRRLRRQCFLQHRHAHGGLDVSEPARLQRVPHPQRGLVARTRDRADEPRARARRPSARRTRSTSSPPPGSSTLPRRSPTKPRSRSPCQGSSAARPAPPP